MESDSRTRGKFFLITLTILGGLFYARASWSQNPAQLASSQQNSADPSRYNELTSVYAAHSATNSTPDDSRDIKADQKAALKKALQLYNKNSYAEAIPYFKKVIQNDSVDKTVLLRLAECYRITNDLQGQLYCYGTLVSAGMADPIHEIYYGRVLIENKEKEKADFYFDKYATDSRNAELAEGFGKNKNFKRNADAFQIIASSFNSPFNDLSAVHFRGETIFVSSRPTTWLDKKIRKTPHNNLLSVAGITTNDKALNKLFSQLNTNGNENAVCFNADYSKVYVTTDSKRKALKANDGTFKLRILEGTLAGDELTELKELPFVNKEYNYAQASLSADGQTIYFSSDQPGGKGGMDLYKSVIQPDGSWGAAINLGDRINTGGNEVYPFVSHDGKLFFSSDGREGMGGLDIYESTIKENAFGYVYNVGEPVNSPYNDFGFYLDRNNKGYITSSRHSKGSDDDVFGLAVTREIKRGKDVLIVIKDKQSGQPVADCRLLVNGDTVYSSARGELISLVQEDLPLRITSLSEDHFRLQDSILFNGPEIVKEIILEKRPKVFLRGLLTDITTNELLEGVRVRIKDLVTGQMVDDYMTNHAGDYFKFLNDLRLGEQIHYEFSLQKEGYFEKTFVLKHIITSPGEISLNEHLHLQFGKIRKGLDLAKIAGAEPVYIDPKEGINETEKAELNKIAGLMLEYPAIAVEVGTHTDCHGKAVSNMGRTAEQAKMIMEYLLSKGIDKVRLSARGYGESKLLNNCGCEGKLQSDCPEEEHAKNRRTEFVITEVF